MPHASLDPLFFVYAAAFDEDPSRSLDRIVRDLAARYNAPVEQIGGDVRDFLTGLIERRMVFLKDAA